MQTAVFAVLNDSSESAIHTIKLTIYITVISPSIWTEDSIMSQVKLKTSYHLLQIDSIKTNSFLSF